MIRTDWSYALVKTRACSDAVMWAREQPSYEVAWESCERGDWLLWLAGRRCTPGDAAHKSVVVAACACARTVLQYVPSGETRPLRAIEAAEAWCRGEATLGDVLAASYAAYTAYDAYAACSACSAAYAAANATNGVYVAYAYAAAANATYATYAAYAADGDARSRPLASLAVLVRQYVARPELP